MFPHRERRLRLVLAHQAGIADDVDGYDRGETGSRDHSSRSPAIRKPSRYGSAMAKKVGSSFAVVY